jgi:transposase
MVVNPKPAPGQERGAPHHFAKAILQRRKNDPIDAAMLRQFGRRMDFVPWPPPRRALTREAQALSKAVAAAKTRLQAIVALMRKLLPGLHAMWRTDQDCNAQKLFAPA